MDGNLTIINRIDTILNHTLPIIDEETEDVAIYLIDLIFEVRRELSKWREEALNEHYKEMCIERSNSRGGDDADDLRGVEASGA